VVGIRGEVTEVKPVFFEESPAAHNNGFSLECAEDALAGDVRELLRFPDG
jgi:hypothetical protein